LTTPETVSNRRPLIAPSLLSCDFSRLKEEIQEVEQGGCDLLHVDVMDGHFVPNLTIGPVVVQWIRRSASLPLDVHLMIDEPVRHLESFRKAGSDSLTVHVEACSDVPGTLEAIRRLGAKVGISLRPRTPVETLFPYLDRLDLILVMTVEPGFGGQAFLPEMLEKVKELRKRFPGKISVDGGINAETAPQAITAGADILVAGTAIFGQKDRARAIRSLRP
jgi:ribulose-phosphate 3-epimerase